MIVIFDCQRGDGERLRWLNVRTLELYQRIARQDYQVKSISIAEKPLYTAVMETRTAGDEPVMAGLLRGY